MTHNRDHIVIHSAKSTISIDPDSTTGKVRVWHVAAALLIVGFLAGLAL